MSDETSMIDVGDGLALIGLSAVIQRIMDVHGGKLCLCDSCKSSLLMAVAKDLNSLSGVPLDRSLATLVEAVAVGTVVNDVPIDGVQKLLSECFTATLHTFSSAEQPTGRA